MIHLTHAHHNRPVWVNAEQVTHVYVVSHFDTAEDLTMVALVGGASLPVAEELLEVVQSIALVLDFPA